jgi:hypothetical protein
MTASKSLPAMPSTMQWCTFDSNAQQSSLRPSMSHISHNG